MIFFQRREDNNHTYFSPLQPEAALAADPDTLFCAENFEALNAQIAEREELHPSAIALEPILEPSRLDYNGQIRSDGLWKHVSFPCVLRQRTAPVYLLESMQSCLELLADMPHKRLWFRTASVEKLLDNDLRDLEPYCDIESPDFHYQYGEPGIIIFNNDGLPVHVRTAAATYKPGDKKRKSLAAEEEEKRKNRIANRKSTPVRAFGPFYAALYDSRAVLASYNVDCSRMNWRSYAGCIQALRAQDKLFGLRFGRDMLRQLPQVRELIRELRKRWAATEKTVKKSRCRVADSDLAWLKAWVFRPLPSRKAFPVHMRCITNEYTYGSDRIRAYVPDRETWKGEPGTALLRKKRSLRRLCSRRGYTPRQSRVPVVTSGLQVCNFKFRGTRRV